MSPEKIDSHEAYMSLVELYGGRGAVTNDYLQAEVPELAARGSLSAVRGESNLFILVSREGFSRLYYYINDFSEKLTLPDGPVTSEIIFRGQSGVPEAEISYLEACGLRRHLLRDQYSGQLRNLAGPLPIIGITIDVARNPGEVAEAVALFDSVFDPYTGDHIDAAHYQSLAEAGDIIIARADGNTDVLGALHRTSAGSVTWLSHVAVRADARGRHIGRFLLDRFVEDNAVTDKSRYMLWVQSHNTPAVEMYRTKGFIYAGKSSQSMLKL